MTTDKKNFVPQIYSGKTPTHEGHDLSKRWFVYITRVTPSGNKRHKEYGQINKFHSIEERLIECDKIVAELYATLHQGDERYLKHVLAIELKRRCLKKRRKSISTYESKLQLFLHWINYLPVNEIKLPDAKRFVEYLFNKGLSSTTVNAYVWLIKSLTNNLGAKNNPFAQIEKYKENPKSLMYFDSTDIEKIEARLKTADPQQWLVAQFLYYCFIRPGELRQLKWENVNFTTQQIYIPGEIAKNGNSAYITIPDPFYKYLLENKLNWQSKSNYLVGQCDNTKMWGRDTISKQHRKHLEALGYTRNYSLYSWKHTGVVKVALSGINMKELQLQLRHSSLDMVNEYLKNLGVYDCTNIKTKFPPISAAA